MARNPIKTINPSVDVAYAVTKHGGVPSRPSFAVSHSKCIPSPASVFTHSKGCDSCAGGLAFDKERSNNLALQARLDSITRDHGDAYLDGIQPRFDPLKARHFDSSWNWARQDALLMHCDIIHGTVDREISTRCIAINRADPDILRYMRYHIDRTAKLLNTTT